jgi:IrrE N-terminal-like domain
LFTPESELVVMVINYIDDIKRQYAMWTNPFDLAHELEISIAVGKLGPDQEGAAFAERIVLDPASGVKARQRFTFYHEIVHHLVRRNDKLYSILHDQYRSDEDLIRIIERLCNVGAAEFIIPRRTVLAAIDAEGFSILPVRDLSRADEVSPTAVCIQLALCAKHGCIATVCRMVLSQKVDSLGLFGEVEPRMGLQVETAVSSSYTKYRIARGSLIPKGHLLYETYEAATDDIVSDIAQVPFRSKRTWLVKCEGICIGKQVFGLFHLDPPPINSRHQLRLF